MPNIREQFSSKPSSTRLKGELKDARANLDERVARFDEPAVETGDESGGKAESKNVRLIPAAAVAAGVAAVILAGGKIDGAARSIGDSVWNLIRGADTYGMLQHPYSQVNAEVNSGAISASDVVRVTVRKPESAFGEALLLTGGDHNPNPVSDTIEHQQGTQLTAGEHLILQAGSIDPQTPQR